MRIRKIGKVDNQLYLFDMEAKKDSMRRVYHHYEKWEEYKQGMWRIVSVEERTAYKSKASDLMKDIQGFKEAMRRVTLEWPFSTENNLTDKSQNRLAWLGHAGCCVSLGSPEDATREAWWTLNEPEQKLANQAAEDIIKEWEVSYVGRKCA